jgi:uncharacterized membrane protein YjfL (UPF0719 family)
MELKLDVLMQGVVSAVVFTTVGVAFFLVTFYVLHKLAPFSLRKEIEEDQNTAVGIVIGAVIIGIAMIVSAALHG